jgi:hypothetical protein
MLAVLAGLVCVQGACSLRSLDYLKDGHKQDSAARDSAYTDAVNPETSKPDAAIFDAVQRDTWTGSGGDGQGGESDGEDAIEKAADGPAAGQEAALGAADDAAPDGDDGVVIGGIEDAGGDEPVAMEAGGVSIDDAGDTEAMAAAPEVDGAILDGSNQDAITFDSPLDDGVLRDSQIPDKPILPDNPPTRPSVLFVVGAIPLSSADASIQTRMIGSGYDVTLVKDTNLASVTSVTATVVLISHTATPGDVTTKFRDTARPVMVCQPSIFADMAFVDGTFLSQGSSLLSYTSLVINAAAGELAAGLSGTVAVLKSSANLNYGTPNNHALSVASLPGQSGYSSIFAYDTGDPMYNLAAPARRVAFFLSANNATDLTANGWLLFDSALAWLAKS